MSKISSATQNKQTNSFISSLYKKMPSKTQLGVAIMSALALKLFSHTVPYLRNYMTSEVPCEFGENKAEHRKNFENYHQGATNGNVFDQYCVAQMYKEGNGTKASNNEALLYFKSAREHGLAIANDDLCAPSLFCGLNVSEFSSTFFSQLEFYCCPALTPSICPWDVPLEIMSPSQRSYCLLN